MKKENIFNFFLIALPVAAVGVAATGKSVTIYDRMTNTKQYLSYFELLPEGTLQMATPLAAILAIITAILAVAYVISKKKQCIVGVYVCSFASLFSAEIPSLMQNELMILPNVLVPGLLLADCIMAYSRMKKPGEKKEETGRRLQIRR